MYMVRHCPRCQSDYRPDMAECAECGGPLEDRPEGSDPRFTPPPASLPSEGSDLADGDLHSIYFSRDVRQLQALADRLARRGVACRLQQSTEGGKSPRYDLLVPEAQRQVSLDELQQTFGDPIPGEELGAVERDFDPSQGYLRCPACGANLAAGAPECSDCGLALAEGKEGTCQECGGSCSSDRCEHPTSG